MTVKSTAKTLVTGWLVFSHNKTELNNNFGRSTLNLVFVLLGGIFEFIFAGAAKNFSLYKPGKLQLFIEMMIDFINGVVYKNFKAATNTLIAPMALTIFFWVC